MDNPVSMRIGKAGRNLYHDLDFVPQRERFAAFNDMLQVLAFEQLHDDKRQAVLLAEIVDRYDIGVTQPPGRGRFIPEPGEHRCVVIYRQGLDRHQTIQRGILGAVDLSESTAP